MQTDANTAPQRGDLRCRWRKNSGYKNRRCVKQQQNSIIQLVPCIVLPMLSPIRLPNQLVNLVSSTGYASSARQTKSTYPQAPFFAFNVFEVTRRSVIKSRETDKKEGRRGIHAKRKLPKIHNTSNTPTVASIGHSPRASYCHLRQLFAPNPAHPACLISGRVSQ